VIDGLGGGFAAATGTLAMPGAYSATTATCVTANFKALISVALQGDPGPMAPTYARRSADTTENATAPGVNPPSNLSAIQG